MQFLGIKCIRRAFLTLTCFYAVTAFADEPDALKNDHQLYQGTWNIVRLVVNGKPVAEQDAKKISVINDAEGGWTILVDGKKISSGTSTIDPNKTPKTIDFTPADGENTGKLFLGVYEISQDSRRLCFAQPGGERPSEFSSTEGNKQVLAVFERMGKSE